MLLGKGEMLSRRLWIHQPIVGRKIGSDLSFLIQAIDPTAHHGLMNYFLGEVRFFLEYLGEIGGRSKKDSIDFVFSNKSVQDGLFQFPRGVRSLVDLRQSFWRKNVHPFPGIGGCRGRIRKFGVAVSCAACPLINGDGSSILIHNSSNQFFFEASVFDSGAKK